MAIKPMQKESEEVVIESSAVEEAPVVDKPQKAKKIKPLYIAKFMIYHPYQNIYIFNIPIEVELDNWLQSQLDAGIITQC
jgi:hypothetical protein